MTTTGMKAGIPTRQFRVEGKTGKFSVGRVGSRMVDGSVKFEAFWNGGAKGHAFACAASREEALTMIVSRAA